MVSNPQIISDLRVIMEADHDLELLTNYKGVPFICRAKIESVGEELTRIRAKDPAMVCLIDDRKPRVLGSDYFEPSVAQIVSFDITTGLVELENFSYVGTKLGERMIVRVEPKEPIQIQIEAESQKITGQLVDISINGIGIRVAEAAYSPMLKPGTNLQCNMVLPSGEIHLAGTILSAFKLEGSYRLSIRFTQNGPYKALIFKYLVDRRAEIEKELQETYETALQAAQ